MQIVSNPLEEVFRLGGKVIRNGNGSFTSVLASKGARSAITKTAGTATEAAIDLLVAKMAADKEKKT